MEDIYSLEIFNEEVVKEIVRFSEDICKNKNIRFFCLEDFESNVNFVFEF